MTVRSLLFTEKKCQASSNIVTLMQIFKSCLLPFSENNEDKNRYYQPRWISVKNSTKVWNKLDLSELCPKPWRYQSPQTLQTLPYQGLKNIYDGGGYVADLGYNEELASDAISVLQNNEWINDFTVAVFIEFSVHEPSSRLFSIVKYLYERLPTGGVVTTVNVQTLALYPPLHGYFNIFYELSQLFFVFSILILLLLEIKELVRQKKAYFTEVWNWVNVLQILTSTSAAIIGVLKARETSLYVKTVQKNPYSNSSPDRLARLSEYEDYLLSLVIFIVTIRLLNLFKFNSHVCNMQATLRRSAKSLFSFIVVFGNSLMAFSFAGFLTFGENVASFSSFYRSFETVVRMSVGGKVNFSELKLHHQIIAPLFLSMFVMWMVLVLVNISVVILVDFYKVERGEDASNSSMVSFMYSYFLAKTIKVLNYFPSRAKSKVVKRRLAYSKPHWKRTGRKIIAVSRTLQLARSQTGIKDPEYETFLPFQEFDFSQGAVHWGNIGTCNQDSNSMCSESSALCSEVYMSENITGRPRNKNWHVNLLPDTNSFGRIPLASNLIVYRKDLEKCKTSVSRQLALKLASIEFVLSINDIDIDYVKSNVVLIALELNKMLSDFKSQTK